MLPTPEVSSHCLLWQALIQCEQLKSELDRQTERLEKELAAQQEKRALEKEMIKKEVTKEREDAESKVLARHFPWSLVGRNLRGRVIRGRTGFGSVSGRLEGKAVQSYWPWGCAHLSPHPALLQLTVSAVLLCIPFYLSFPCGR